jgi:hypothetical protein
MSVGRPNECAYRNVSEIEQRDWQTRQQESSVMGSNTAGNLRPTRLRFIRQPANLRYFCRTSAALTRLEPQFSTSIPSPTRSISYHRISFRNNKSSNRMSRGNQRDTDRKKAEAKLAGQVRPLLPHTAFVNAY